MPNNPSPLPDGTKYVSWISLKWNGTSPGIPVPDEQLILAFKNVVNMLVSLFSTRTGEPVSFWMIR